MKKEIWGPAGTAFESIEAGSKKKRIFKQKNQNSKSRSNLDNYQRLACSASRPTPPRHGAYIIGNWEVYGSVITRPIYVNKFLIAKFQKGVEVFVENYSVSMALR